MVIESYKELKSLISAFNNRKPIIIDRNLVNKEKELKGIIKLKNKFKWGDVYE